MKLSNAILLSVAVAAIHSAVSLLRMTAIMDMGIAVFIAWVVAPAVALVAIAISVKEDVR